MIEGKAIMEEKKYIHVRNIEKFHPGYKDRQLSWAKMYFNMVQGDPDCEMIENEIDWARLIKFIILELQAKKPIPLDEKYLSKKNFDLKKRSIFLTLQMLHNFVDIVTVSVTEENLSDTQVCVIEKRREENIREEKENIREEKKDGLSLLQRFWNSSCYNLPKVLCNSNDRKVKEKIRLNERSLVKWKEVFVKINQSKFCCGQNKESWKASYDWIMSNEKNAIKVLEGNYDNKQGAGTKTQVECRKEETFQKSDDKDYGSGVERGFAGKPDKDL